MRRVLHILVREYLENVRTKAFLIGVILTPLWFGVMFLVPMMAKQQEPSDERIVVVDRTGALAGPLARILSERTTRSGKARFDVEIRDGDVAPLREQAAEGDLVAVVLTQAVLEKRPPREGEPDEAGILHPASVGGADTARELQAVVNDLVNERVMAARGIAKEDAALLAKEAIRSVPLSRGGAEGGLVQALTPFIFMMFLFMGIVGISQMLVNSTIEEKASRVYELLLSSVSPSQLMAGKVAGICLVGFTLLGLWVGGGLLAAQLQGLDGVATGAQLGLFAVYYVLGFLLIASLMVAIGSACNTLKEAQNLMAPLSVLLALPILLAMVIMKDPNGPLATVASFIPPFTPFLMMVRISAVPGPPAWQIPASIALLALSTLVAVHLAGRVFRVGILMYGKPPSLGEILRWLREG